MMCGLQPIVFDPNLGPSNNGNFWRKICVWKIRSPEDFLQLFLLDTLQARRAAMTGRTKFKKIMEQMVGFDKVTF